MDHVFNRKLKNMTKVMVTHKLELLKYADRVAVMDKLKIAELGTLEEVKQTDIYKDLQAEQQRKMQEEEEVKEEEGENPVEESEAAKEPTQGKDKPDNIDQVKT